MAKLSQVIQIDDGKIQAHLGEVVRSTVEETLNAMLDAEADRLCRAERYERTELARIREGSRSLHPCDPKAGASFAGFSFRQETEIFPRQLHRR